MPKSSSLEISTFHFGVEQGESVPVTKSPLMDMIKVFTDRVFDPEVDNIVNLAYVENADPTDTHPVKVLLATGDVADHIAKLLRTYGTGEAK